MIGVDVEVVIEEVFIGDKKRHALNHDECSVDNYSLNSCSLTVADVDFLRQLEDLEDALALRPSEDDDSEDDWSADSHPAKGILLNTESAFILEGEEPLQQTALEDMAKETERERKRFVSNPIANVDLGVSFTKRGAKLFKMLGSKSTVRDPVAAPIIDMPKNSVSLTKKHPKSLLTARIKGGITAAPPKGAAAFLSAPERSPSPVRQKSGPPTLVGSESSEKTRRKRRREEEKEKEKEYRRKKRKEKREKAKAVQAKLAKKERKRKDLKENRRKAKEQVSQVVNKELSKYYKQGRFASKDAFKYLARKYTKAILEKHKEKNYKLHPKYSKACAAFVQKSMSKIPDKFALTEEQKAKMQSKSNKKHKKD